MIFQNGETLQVFIFGSPSAKKMAKIQLRLPAIQSLDENGQNGPPKCAPSARAGDG